MNSPESLLSVIIPVSNVENYIGNCIESLLKQQYDNLEIILVDDGSTDNSFLVCQEYANKDTRIKLFKQEKLGVSIARNKALEYAQGEFITFVDSDDAILPETYLCALKILSKNPECDQVQFPLHKKVGTPNPEIIVNHLQPIYGSEEMIHNFIVNRDVSWIVCNKIFKREAIAGLIFKPGFVYEDNLFVAQQLWQSKGICFSTEGAYLYYYRGGSITNTFTNKNLLDMIKIHCEIYDTLGTSKQLSTARGYMSYMIACDVYACSGWYKGKQEIVEVGFRHLKRSPWREIWEAKGLAFRRQLKTIGIKLVAHLHS